MEAHPVITLRGFGEADELSRRCAPVEIAVVNDNATYTGAVPADPLGRTVGYDVRT